MDTLDRQDGDFPLNTLLLDLACRSAMLRVLDRFDGVNATDTSDLRSSIRDDMARLGRTLKRSGLDARAIAYWNLVECKYAYEEEFERSRRVECAELTPMAIYRSLSNGNHLVWKGWEIYVGGSREVTDGYGCPAWESRIWLQPPSGELTMVSGISREQARAIYRRVTGVAFSGVDTLGHDDPHPAEKLSVGDIVEYEAAQGRGLIASSRCDEHWQKFETLAIEDPAACLALFDSNGRYLDTATGFWVSLRAEYLNRDTGSWGRAHEPSELDEFMAEHGVAAYRMGDVYEADADRDAIPDCELDKWFVSLWSDSPYSKQFGELPLTDTEGEALELAKNLAKEVLARQGNLITNTA